DGVSVVELDRDQRFDQHLVALSDEMGSQRRRIRFGACDEEAHSTGPLKEVGAGDGAKLAAGIISDGECVSRRTLSLDLMESAAVRREYQPAKLNGAVPQFGEPCNRSTAASFKSREECAFGFHANGRRLMIQGRHELRNSIIVVPNFDSDCTLRDSG